MSITTTGSPTQQPTQTEQTLSREGESVRTSVAAARALTERSDARADPEVTSLQARLVEMERSQADIDTIAPVRLSLARCYRNLKRYEEAIQEYELILTRVADETNTAGVCYNMANCYFDRAQPQSIFPEVAHIDRAIASCKRGLSYSGADPRVKNLLETLLRDIYALMEKAARMSCGVGDAQGRERGDHAQAIPHYKRGYEYALRSDQFQLVTDLSSALGISLSSLGRTQEARQYHEKSLGLARELHSPRYLAMAHGNMGIFLTQCGFYLEAEPHFFEQERYAKSLSDNELVGTAYNGLGGLYLKLGQPDRALPQYQKYLALLGNVENTIKCRVLQSCATCYMSLGELDEADKCYQAALPIAESSSSLLIKGAFYGSLGSFYRKKGDLNQAIACHMKSLHVAEQLQNPREIALACGHLGAVYTDAQRYDEAKGLYERGLTLAKTDLQDYEEELNHMHNLAYIYYLTGDYPQAIALLKEALSLIQKIQKTQEARDEWKITLFERQATTYHLLESVYLKDRNNVASIFRALEISDARRARVLTDLLLKKREQELSPCGASLSIEQMREFVRSKQVTAVIYSLSPFFESRAACNVWIIPASGEVVFQELPLEAISADIAAFHATLPQLQELRNRESGSPTPSEDDDTTSESRGPKENLLRNLKEWLKKWHRMFIDPINTHLPQDPNRTLVIVPDQALSLIPFAALIQANGHYLIEQHPIIMAPSIHALYLLNAYPAPRSHEALSVGNPKTSDRNLPFAAKEVELLSSKLGEPLTQEQATISAILQRLNSSCRWIHLACHGNAAAKEPGDPYSVFRGCLQFVPDAAHADGSLYARQVAKMNLDSELVFMSACSSGIGTLAQEGSIGPVWSFLAAGARSTMATLWALPDSQLTVDMVAEFYGHILGDPPLSKAKALQEVMLKAIQRDRGSPDKWGGFFLSGLAL
jgi:CHAT domain-containing protein/Tfp pilus assembly protein PilF